MVLPPPQEDETLVEESKGNKTLPVIKSTRLFNSKAGSSLNCLSSVATFNSSRRRNMSPKNDSAIGSPASRLFDLTSSMQNKQQPAHYPPFKSRFKVAKTKRGHSFKLKCTSVQPEGEQVSTLPADEGLANMRLSINFDCKRRSNPETQVSPIREHQIEDNKGEQGLNDSDLACLENLRHTLSAKKSLVGFQQVERTSHRSRDSAEE